MASRRMIVDALGGTVGIGVGAMAVGIAGVSIAVGVI